MRATPSHNLDELKLLGLNAIRELEVADGILASGRDEAYGCIFGRDSLLVALALLHTHEREPDPYYVRVAEKVLTSLSNLQGRHENIESGEQPGKIVHEYRPQKHEHLTQLSEDPWFVYPEGVMRNYDSVDSTLLFLLLAAKYKQVGNARLARTFEGPVRRALEWTRRFDDFITYEFHTDRKHGGLKVQSWMDSTESLFYEEDDTRPPYPVAPVEAQAYAWAALKAWGEDARAAALKKRFNESFVLRGPKSVTLAFALDGNGRKLTAPRSSMGHVLWAAHQNESILDSQYIEPLRRRLLARDLFVPSAGLRTLSNRSRHYDPMSYHNGSIWPHDTAMFADGLQNFGYHEDAARVRRALLRAYAHFKTPIELFAFKKGIKEYAPQSGHRACRVQAWSAAGLISILSAVQ